MIFFALFINIILIFFVNIKTLIAILSHILLKLLSMEFNFLFKDLKFLSINHNI